MPARLANVPPTQPEAPMSAIRARRRPVPMRERAGTVVRRFEGASRWRETRAGTARVSPRSPILRRARRSVRQQPRGMERPPDAHGRERWCRRRSPAATFIRQVSNAIPRSIAKVRVQPFALEAGTPQLEGRTRPGVSDDTVQAALDQRPERHSLSCGQPAGLAQERIGYLYGRLHR